MRSGRTRATRFFSRFLVEGPTIIFPHQPIRLIAWRTLRAGRLITFQSNPVHLIFPAEAAVLANESDQLRQANLGDPGIKDLNWEIRQLITQHKRTKLKEHVTSGVSKLWSTVRSLSNPSRHNDKADMTFNDCTSSDPKRCASRFRRKFILHPLADRFKPSATRWLHKLTYNSAPLAFSSYEVQGAINHMKPSEVIGPDGLNIPMLKKRGPLRIDYLTRVFNMSMAILIIFDKCKSGRVVPLLKPGKPVN